MKRNEKTSPRVARIAAKVLAKKYPKGDLWVYFAEPMRPREGDA